MSIRKTGTVLRFLFFVANAKKENEMFCPSIFYYKRRMISMADATYPKCHIYSQDSWHGEAYIVGNRAGLEKLRNALNATLEKGNTKNTFWPNDDESYDLFMACMNEDDFESLKLPYTHDIDEEGTEAYEFFKKPYYTVDE